MIFLQIWFVDFVNALAVFSLLFITNKSLIPIIARLKMYKVDQKPTTYHIRINVCMQPETDGTRNDVLGCLLPFTMCTAFTLLHTFIHGN